ncbi:MAG: histidine triad nucleotide-binding protein [Anaerolineales bacterium]|nr:histidine triad nucleotide-binding protein [Anaerolineales bacterium]MCZ2120869.1 histidine triad nucleotide-binding protein [Anaerolineales bacterium]
MTDCIFCKIIAGEIPSSQVYRDEQATAFRDINPAAPTHILIVPNKHLDSVNQMEAADEPLIGHLFSIAKSLAAEAGLTESGYRLIVNTGAGAGQTVFHLHLHLLGGKSMNHLLG